MRVAHYNRLMPHWRSGFLLLLLACGTAWAEEYVNTRVGILEEFPREVPRGKQLIIKGKLKGKYRTPELVIIAPDGKTYLNKKGHVTPTTFAWDAELTGGVGLYRMEILCHTHVATQSVARFNIWHGKRKPKNWTEPPIPVEPRNPPEWHPRLIEKHMLDAINALRKEIKLKPAGWNEAVAARAREHADRMARAKRRVHAFGKLGIREMLRKDGAGKDAPYSGFALPWPGLTSTRPFNPYNLRPAVDDPPNHVIVNVLRSVSLTSLMERYYAREPGFRLLAADPHLVEVAIGCARPRSGNPHEIYYCICWVQVNNKAVKERQDDAYRDLLKAVPDGKPELLRRMAMWQRPRKAEKLLLAAIKSDEPERLGAAWDGLLLLDQKDARRRIAKALKKAKADLKRERFGDAYLALSGLMAITYDRSLIEQPGYLRKEVELSAETALEAIRLLPEEKQPRKIAEFRKRCFGMPVLKQLPE